MVSRLKNWVRFGLPFAWRAQLAIWVNRHPRLFPDHLAVGLIRDLQWRDPTAFHKFLWTHHFMGYARWYDSQDALFSVERMEPSRQEFFKDLPAALADAGVKAGDVRSVLEIGCSLGYLLRYIETAVFPQSDQLVGLDIDAEAIRKGRAHLQDAGSRVRLIPGDMEELDRLVPEHAFDVVYAAGVLSYLDEPSATAMVARLLARTRGLLALVGLACTTRNNRELERSELSPNHTAQWIHNFEAMVARAGGRVVRTRWEGAKEYNLQTICFVFAVPAPVLATEVRR